MKAAVLKKPYELVIEEREIPKLKENEVLVKVAYCGVCGTDVHLYEGNEGSVKLVPGTVPGHELSGTVEASGCKVDIEIGQKVVIDPNFFCGYCDKCRNGMPHFCENIFNTGVTVDGGFAQYAKAHIQQVHILPKGVSLLEGAFAEPLSCCIHGMDLANIKPSSRVLIIGGGTIGLLMAQLSQIYGASYTALSEPVEIKRNLALQLGVDAVYNPEKEKINDKFDVIIECVGKPSTMKWAVDNCDKCGTVMMFGLTDPDDEISIKPFDLFKREIKILASYINPFTMKKAISFLSNEKIDVKLLAGQQIKLEELSDVLESPSRRKNGKVLVYFE